MTIGPRATDADLALISVEGINIELERCRSRHRAASAAVSRKGWAARVTRLEQALLERSQCAITIDLTISEYPRSSRENDVTCDVLWDLSSQHRRAKDLAANSPEISQRIANREIAISLAARIAAIEAARPSAP